MKFILLIYVIVLYPSVSFTFDGMVKEYNIKSGNYTTYIKQFADPSIQDAKKDKLNKTKQEALRRIILLIPGATQENYTIKETNLLSRVAELTRKEYKNTITSSELIELDYYDAIWQEVKDIRTASDNIETEINALITYDAIQDYNIETNILWP